MKTLYRPRKIKGYELLSTFCSTSWISVDRHALVPAACRKQRSSPADCFCRRMRFCRCAGSLCDYTDERRAGPDRRGDQGSWTSPRLLYLREFGRDDGKPLGKW